MLDHSSVRKSGPGCLCLVSGDVWAVGKEHVGMGTMGKPRSCSEGTAPLLKVLQAAGLSLSCAQLPAGPCGEEASCLWIQAAVPSPLLPSRPVWVGVCSSFPGVLDFPSGKQKARDFLGAGGGGWKMHRVQLLMAGGKCS